MRRQGVEVQTLKHTNLFTKVLCDPVLSGETPLSAYVLSICQNPPPYTLLHSLRFITMHLKLKHKEEVGVETGSV